MRRPHSVAVHTVTVVSSGSPGRGGMPSHTGLLDDGARSDDPVPSLTPYSSCEHQVFRVVRVGGVPSQCGSPYRDCGIDLSGSHGRGGMHPIKDCWMMEPGLMTLYPLSPHTHHLNIRYPELWLVKVGEVAVHTVTALLMERRRYPPILCYM